MNDQTEYFVECLGGWLGTWYFVSRLRGLRQAIELAAVMREIKGHPARVVLAPERPTGAWLGGPVATVRR